MKNSQKQPVDVQFKYCKDPRVVNLAILHDEEKEVMGVFVNDRMISESGTSYYLEPFTDDKGMSRLGRRVPVMAVFDAVPGTFGKGRWKRTVEISNFLVKETMEVNVILIRTNTGITDVKIEDVEYLLGDRQVKFWLYNMYSMVWSDNRTGPHMWHLVLKAEMIESEMISMLGLAMPVVRDDKAYNGDYDSIKAVVTFMANTYIKRWERWEVWRMIRMIQPIKSARLIFAVSERLRLLMMMVMKVADLQNDMSSFKMDVIGYQEGEEVKWPTIHICHVEF